MSMVVMSCSMCIVPMIRISMVAMPIFFILRLTQLISFIPSCFYEYFECRIEVDDDNKENECDNSENR